MENKEKYFIPEMHDFYLEYEFELQTNKGWKKGIFPNLIEEESDNFGLVEKYKHDIFMKLAHAITRVPYLTKEQIENEGWTLQEEFPYVHSIGFIKNVTYRETNHTVFLYYNYSSKWLLITIQSVIDNIYSIKYTTEKTDININGNTLYAGTCLDINTFRYICKLLEI